MIETKDDSNKKELLIDELRSPKLSTQLSTQSDASKRQSSVSSNESASDDHSSTKSDEHLPDDLDDSEDIKTKKRKGDPKDDESTFVEESLIQRPTRPCNLKLGLISRCDGSTLPKLLTFGPNSSGLNRSFTDEKHQIRRDKIPPLSFDPWRGVTPSMQKAGLLQRRGSSVQLTLSFKEQGTSLDGLPTPAMTWSKLTTSSCLLKAADLHKKVLDKEALSEEYDKIPENHASKGDIKFGGFGIKNRYKNMIPNENSRVLLKSKESREIKDALESFINANYIRKFDIIEKDEKQEMTEVINVEDADFIATQGPLCNTQEDFWNMVLENNSKVIVMITKLHEEREKCAPYFPLNVGDIKTFSRISVSLVDISTNETFETRKLKIEYGKVVREVIHYFYSGWLDHQTPEKSRGILELVRQVSIENETRVNSPVIVHCSAGIGRTGCFIAISYGCKQLVKNSSVDILKIVSRLRLDRGGLVQTVQQYHFIHEALSRYMRQLSGENVLTPEPNHDGSPVKRSFQPSVVNFRAPFKASPLRKWKRSFSASNLPLSSNFIDFPDSQPSTEVSATQTTDKTDEKSESPTVEQARIQLKNELNTCRNSNDRSSTEPLPSPFLAPLSPRQLVFSACNRSPIDHGYVPPPSAGLPNMDRSRFEFPS